ncbi:MAG: ribonuclease HIII [Candidatus Aenigmarchaeota archaeon]|nr:ribonuclease HIII [Candidatus Aenigmarchaeota archaeon]
MQGKSVLLMGHIGVDEAGKGDYFGYLVIAGAFADEKTERKLKAIGVRDSKTLSDFAVKNLAAQIKKMCAYDIVKISPEKYNQLYKKFSSLNKLLAWGHARVIENLLSKVKCNLVITDKFGDESLIKNALMEKGKKITLIQKINAEADMAVAAASILARDEFLKTLRALGREVDTVLPKGATHVEDTAKALVEKHGSEILNLVAKIHFKITKRVLKGK